MSKNMQIFAVLFLGGCILFGFSMIANALGATSQQPESQQPLGYELISPNENNIIMYDKESGQYWRKFIPSNEGPTEWEQGEMPWE